MILRIYLLFGLLASYCIHRSHQESIVIERQCLQKCTETIRTTSDDGQSNKTTPCDEGFSALQTITSGVQCIAETEIRKDIGTVCDFGFNNFTKDSGVLPGNLFAVKVFQQNVSYWMDKRIPCLKFNRTEERYDVEVSSCNATNSYAGLLLKIGYRVSPNSSMRCVIFTVPGTVSEMIVEDFLRTSTTTHLSTTNPTTNVTNATVATTITKDGTFTTTSSSSNKSNNTVVQPSTATTMTTTFNISGGILPKTETPITKDKDESKKPPLHIILPVCLLLFSIIVIVLFLIFCRRRCKRSKDAAVPLLEINSRENGEDEEMALYAIPDKKKAKKKPKEDIEPVSVPVWSGYDEVGAFIEGTYEARDSVHIDPDSKYGVSAMLLKEDNAGTTLETPENPYERLGRCNSFTPKTRAEKSKYQKQREDKQNGGNEPADSTDRLVPPPSITTDDNGNDNKDPQLQKYSPTMPMSSFKPGNSMRRKQERTSMKKPSRTLQDPAASLTHEVVNITPQPSKKNKNPPNNTTTNNKDDGDEKNEIDSKSASSIEDQTPTSKPPIALGEGEPPKSDDGSSADEAQTAAEDSSKEDDLYEKVFDEDDQLDGYEKIHSVSLPGKNNDNKIDSERENSNDDIDESPEHLQNGDTPTEDKTHSEAVGDDPHEELGDNPYEELGETSEKDNPGNNKEDEKLSNDEDNYEPLPETINEPKPKKASYADIEIIKDKKDKKKKLKSSSKKNKTNYTDVIIDAD